VYFTLSPALKKYFPDNQNLFDQIMSLRGKIYRELEGRRTQRIELGGRGYFLKQHFGVGWREIFKNLLQWRLPVLSAKNEWRALERLQQLNIATLQTAGFGCRGNNPAQLQSFLLTDELTQMISLEDLCKNWKKEPPQPGFKRALIKEVARIARTLHDNGINHRDFYLCHFLWETASKKNLYLIDLHRAQIRKHTPLRWVIKDLAGLYFSSKDSGLTTRDWIRFMSEYRQQSVHCSLIKEKNFWQKVKRRGDRIYRQHEK
jgi:heptose I phosphotransferase